MTEPARAFTPRNDLPDEDAVDDWPLLERLQSGDDSALGELHRRHAQAVYWLARNQLVSALDAEEITQDAFLLLWRKCRRIELAGSSCLPWLLVTVNFLALNVRKRRVRAAQHTTEFPSEIPSRSVVEDDALAAIELARVNAIVSRLSAEDQAVYRLCLLDGLSYKQAAYRLRTSHAAVRNRLSRVRETLRKEIDR